MKYSKINILFGPPGSGKTFAAERFAAETGAALVYYQCHDWTDDRDLFVGVDVVAAVAGDAERVRQEGVLARAARLSQEQKVVLVIDELDKAPERVDALLLDFLQSGRVPIAPGEFLLANVDNITTFVISNQYREHSGALLRRGKRFWFSPMTSKEVAQILEKQGFSARAAYAVHKLATALRQRCGAKDGVTVQEVRNFLSDIEGCEFFEEFFNDFVSWFARTDQELQQFVAARAKVGELYGKYEW